MERYSIEVNAGGIIRPNGDFRLDCMAPFTIGNVLEQPLKQLWLEKGITAWQSKEVKHFIEAIDVEHQTGPIRNHVEQDVAI